MSEPIYCLQCGERCGTYYPARFRLLDGGWPAESEGIGENFQNRHGDWFCSQKCLDEWNKIDEEDGK